MSLNKRYHKMSIKSRNMLRKPVANDMKNSTKKQVFLCTNGQNEYEYLTKGRYINIIN